MEASDHSQKAGGDIYNQTCDVNALATLTNGNFATSLRQAYDLFEKKTSDNLHIIIDEANRLIQEKKVDIASYTKIDWINIYLRVPRIHQIHICKIYGQKCWQEN